MSERERFPEGWNPKEDGGYIMGEPMEDGRYWCLLLLTFGRLRIVIAEDQFSAGEHWCYENNVDAVLSYFRGLGEPPFGWKRHMLPDGTFERA